MEDDRVDFAQIVETAFKEFSDLTFG